MRRKRPFSAADLAEIEQAIAQTESVTSGELVVSVVEASDDYLHATWKGTLIGAFGAILAAFAIAESGRVWLPLWFWILAPAAAGGAIGFLLAAESATVRRWLISPELMTRRTEHRAAAAFLRAGLGHTEQHTGILIFLSLLEHRVVVLADRGIAQTVAQGEWDEIARGVASGMRRGEPVATLIQAIQHCGVLLARHRLVPMAGDRNELPNRVRTED